MASRLSPIRSLGRLARTVKNIWTKSEMRRTSQPGSMMSAVLSRSSPIAAGSIGVPRCVNSSGAASIRSVTAAAPVALTR